MQPVHLHAHVLTLVPVRSGRHHVDRDSHASDQHPDYAAQPGPGKPASRCDVTSSGQICVIDRELDKHSLSNSIRSFLAVKRQEVTGLVK